MPQRLPTKYLLFFAWFLSLAVFVAAFVAWAQGFGWHWKELTSYRLFPLFGLLAFSLMWAHYIVAAIKQAHGIEGNITKTYFKVTSFIVLVAIMLHPGLLIWQLWRDGFGLPPGSYLKNYVAPNLEWVALIGTVSWLVFLSYELHRWFSDKTWWKFIQYGSDVAIVAIFYHGLRLGSNLQHGWFHGLWLFYGFTLVAALAFIHLKKLLWHNK